MTESGLRSRLASAPAWLVVLVLVAAADGIVILLTDWSRGATTLAALGAAAVILYVLSLRGGKTGCGIFVTILVAIAVVTALSYAVDLPTGLQLLLDPLVAALFTFLYWDLPAYRRRSRVG